MANPSWLEDAARVTDPPMGSQFGSLGAQFGHQFTPANPVMQQIAAQVTQAQTPMQAAIAAGQVTPLETADILKARAFNPSIPQGPLSPMADLMKQAGAPEPLALNPPKAPVGARWSMAGNIPGTPAVTEVPGGTTVASAAKARPTISMSTTAGISNLDDMLAAGSILDDAAAPAAMKIATIDDLVVNATGAANPTLKAAADETLKKGAGGRGAGVLTGLNTNLNKLIPGLNANITTGSLMTGLTVAGLGLMAGGFVDRFNVGGEGSNLDAGLSGAVMGAGVGAGAAIALGLSTGPIGWAALGGAAIFAVANIFGDHKSAEDKANDMIDKSRQTINNLISTPSYGIDSFTAQQINGQFEAAIGFYQANKDWAGLETYLRGLAQTVPTFLLQASERNQQVQQRMALQASFGPVYADMMTRSSEVAKTAFDTQMRAASQVTDPSISAALKSQAAQQYTANQDLRAAYAQQVAMGTTQLPPGAQTVQDNAQALISQMMTGV